MPRYGEELSIGRYHPHRHRRAHTQHQSCRRHCRTAAAPLAPKPRRARRRYLGLCTDHMPPKVVIGAAGESTLDIPKARVKKIMKGTYPERNAILLMATESWGAGESGNAKIGWWILGGKRRFARGKGREGGRLKWGARGLSTWEASRGADPVAFGHAPCRGRAHSKTDDGLATCSLQRTRTLKWLSLTRCF